MNNKIQVRIEPPKWPEDPVEREKLFQELSRQAQEEARKELEFIFRVIEAEKRRPPSNWLIGNAA